MRNPTGPASLRRFRGCTGKSFVTWRAWNEFDTHRIAFMGVIAVPASLIGLAALYAVQERRPRH